MSDSIFPKVIVILAMFYLVGSGQASADDEFDSSLPTSLLDGTTIVYSYIDGNGTAYRVSFEDGLFDWESVEINFEGGARSWRSKDSSIKGSPYKAHKLSHGEYMMYFIEEAPEPDGTSWASLHINFNTNQIFAASLFFYGKNSETPHQIHWAPGFIYSVTRND